VDDGQTSAGSGRGDQQVRDLHLTVMEWAAGSELAEHSPSLIPVGRLDLHPRTRAQGCLDRIESPTARPLQSNSITTMSQTAILPSSSAGPNQSRPGFSLRAQTDVSASSGPIVLGSI
jgi:hypothetical protein